MKTRDQQPADVSGDSALPGTSVARREFLPGCVADRNRGRIRVRFGVDGKLSEDFVGASPWLRVHWADPTTTNETSHNFFDRKRLV